MPLTYGRRDSLIYQASIERDEIEGIKRRNTITKRKELSRQISFTNVLEKLDDEGLELIKQTNDNDFLHLIVMINTFQDSLTVLVEMIQILKSNGVLLKHIETRPNKNHPGELEILAEIETKKILLMNALDHLITDNTDKIKITVIDRPRIQENYQWIPHHISDLDKCAHVVCKYEPTEDPKHPGYGDEAYIKRRAELNNTANVYRYGEPLPEIEYTQLEHETWKQAYTALKALRETHTCFEYQKNVKEMEDVGLITADKIPSLKKINSYIQKRTGFQLRPCGGLLSARDFLASLAFRVFQTTLYIRHHSKPNHCPEPDVIHEILGHCPMFADPWMAQMSQEIGLLSLGASDEQIERLSTVYWFIIEFGLCEQEGKLRAIGAGLISAFGELQHAVSDVPEHAVFEPEVTALRTYEDSDYQPLYFVAKSIKDAMDKLKKYAISLKRPQIAVYDPFTQTVRQIEREEYAKDNLRRLRDDINELAETMEQLKVTKH